jgi:hypothetical protein
MSINVIEQGHQRTGTIDATSLGEAQRIFLVTSPSPIDDTAALYASGIPTIRSPHPSRIGIYCSKLDARAVGEKEGRARFWEVVCTYAYIDPQIYPWLRAPVYSGSLQHYSFPIDEEVYGDNTGKLIRNSAGDPFSPALERSCSWPVMNVAINVQYFSTIQQWAQLQDTLNSSTWFGWKEAQAKCEAVSFQQSIEAIGITQVNYYAVNLSFAFCPFDWGWQSRVLDAGYYYKDGSGNRQKYLDPFGREPSQPQPLDGMGGKLTPVDTADAQFKTFKTYIENDFSVFGLTPPT